MKRLFLGLLPGILIGIFSLSGCTLLPATPTPELSWDDWQTATPGEVGLDEQLLNEAVERINSGDYPNVHAVLIIKDGKLVFEDYFSGYTWDFYGEKFRGDLVEFDEHRLHNLASVTKSFTSALIGIAIDQGVIPSVEEKVWTYFPEYNDLRDETKDKISLAHLLTMTSGLEWNGMDIPVSSGDTRNDLVQLFMVADPIAYVLAKPVVDEPGTRWYYNGGGTNVLGEVIRKASGMRMDEFAEQYLFSPLGITDYEWDFINPDVIHASGNLRLRPRDMAKLGMLFLNEGVWQGEQILSEDWIKKSTQAHATTSWESGYGYQWWLDTYWLDSEGVDAYYANGWGGQRIMVFPSLDMVVVFTGGNYVEEVAVDEIVEQYILPAVQ